MKTEIRNFILNGIPNHPNNIATITANQYHISRQTAVNYLDKLIVEGLITAVGKTKARRYELRNFVDKSFYKEVLPGILEDVLWREDILPLMNDLTPNVVDICQYGFSEIIRNVFDHSGSHSFLYGLARDAICVQLYVLDHGIGIFNKIQRDFNLDDPRHALLELSKGKLTSDPKGHTGEGIFFTSRMFDEFSILSAPLFYGRVLKGSDWLIEVRGSTQKGTYVVMKTSPYSEKTMQRVFNEFATGKDGYGFTRTHVPIELARYEGEQLVSRSQARRLLARFERFNEVMLDFADVKIIGQAFADEIFRVYHLEHPDIEIMWVNAEKDVEKMILRAKTNIPNATTEQPKLF